MNAADTCGGCGGPYLFDTTIPSETWNRVVRPLGISEYLCLGCIVRIFAERGESFTAELWSGSIEAFNGLPISVTIGPVARKHEWEFYMNGSFCKRCGAAIGSGTPCR